MNELRNQKGFVGKALCYTGLALLALGALVFLSQISDRYGSEELAFTYLLTSAITCLAFLGFSEIVRLLGIIADNTSKDGAQ